MKNKFETRWLLEWKKIISNLKLQFVDMCYVIFDDFYTGSEVCR